MKSLRELAWNVDEDTYRSDSALSYSTIARFNREGFDNLDHLYDKIESPSLLFGSVVDCLLTGTEEEFNSRFLVADFPAIPDSQRKVVDILFNLYGSTGTSLNKLSNENIISVTERVGFQLNWKPETRAKVIKENCSEYWDLLSLAKDKQVIAQTLYEDAIACKNALETSEATKWYFEKDNPFDDSIERLDQLKFKGEYEGIQLRCMADKIIVDHKNKIIFPIDLKTSFKPEWRFYKSFIEWNYWIQAQLYWYIIRQNLDKDPYFKDFKLADYRFIVICNKTRTPLVWFFPLTQTEVDIKIKDVIMRNWRGLVKELSGYLNYERNVPNGIDIQLPNNIISWIENE